VSEIRTIAADELWLSPQYRQDTVALHFTWRPDPAGVSDALGHVEAALAPFRPRAHWGKVFHAGAADTYERLPAFLALLDRFDPRGAFRNAWVDAHLIGDL
jgi:xylitol oxidase